MKKILSKALIIGLCSSAVIAQDEEFVSASQFQERMVDQVDDAKRGSARFVGWGALSIIELENVSGLTKEEAMKRASSFVQNQPLIQTGTDWAKKNTEAVKFKVTKQKVVDSSGNEISAAYSKSFTVSGQSGMVYNGQITHAYHDSNKKYVLPKYKIEALTTSFPGNKKFAGVVVRHNDGAMRNGTGIKYKDTADMYQKMENQKTDYVVSRDGKSVTVKAADFIMYFVYSDYSKPVPKKLKAKADLKYDDCMFNITSGHEGKIKSALDTAVSNAKMEAKDFKGKACTITVSGGASDTGVSPSCATKLKQPSTYSDVNKYLTQHAVSPAKCNDVNGTTGPGKGEVVCNYMLGILRSYYGAKYVETYFSGKGASSVKYSINKPSLGEKFMSFDVDCK